MFLCVRLFIFEIEKLTALTLTYTHQKKKRNIRYFFGLMFIIGDVFVGIISSHWRKFMDIVHLQVDLSLSPLYAW